MTSDERMERAVARLAKIEAWRVKTNADTTPEELILRAYVSRSDRAELVSALSAMEYTFPQYEPYPVEERLMGTWDQLPLAYYQKYISHDELEAVRAAVKPPQE